MLKDMMYTVAQRRANSQALSHITLGMLTAPLLTLSISMQASLPQNRLSLQDIMPATDGSEQKVKREPSRLTQMRNMNVKI